ncbi:hypothetical protein DFS34DRAFT_596825 [Phlyctochytrium arcticum]|nr:hypothetical protein DFS34DRAFT_596825 [Phlyctochytrium arcticum]
MVNLTLDAGIQFSPGGKLWESCFFSTAVKFEQVDILRLLLERNIGSAAWMGWSALESAMKTGVLPLIEPFIEHGIVTRDEAMERAMITGKLELVRALRKRLRPASELSDLLHDAGISAARDHLELVKYFLELIRHKHPKRFQVAVLDEFQSAPTVPMLEFLISLTNGIPDDVRNRALRRALSHAKYEISEVKDRFTYNQSQDHFLYLWKLLGGTSNFSILMHEFKDPMWSTPIYYAIERGFWDVFEICLRYPAFKLRKARSSEMIRALNRAVKDEQEKLLWHIVENIPESRPLLLNDVDLPICRSPALIRILSRCRELLITTKESPALRWEMSALSDVFFNLIVQSKLRPMESVVAPIGLDPDTQTAAVIALRRICLLTMRLMADGNQDASLKHDLRHELVTCAALPGCDTIPKYFARTICTEALQRNEQVLFAIIRDALTGPSYPGGGVFYADDKLKQHWLAIAVQQGLYDVVRIHQSKAPSPKCSIAIRDKPLWQSAVKRAIDDADHAILELLRQTQYTISGYDANELAVILLKPAFLANDHALLQYFRGIGVPSTLEFDDVFLPALYHDLNPEKCPCAEMNHEKAVAKDESVHATMESICVYLGISDVDLELDSKAMNTDEKLTRASCRGSQHIAANCTTLVFNREGHAMCGDCLNTKFKRAKGAWWWDAKGRLEVPDYANNDNIRVGCNTRRISFNLEHINLERTFPVTPSLQRVHLRDAELFASVDDAYVYYDSKRSFSQPDLLDKLETDEQKLEWHDTDYIDAPKTQVAGLIFLKGGPHHQPSAPYHSLALSPSTPASLPLLPTAPKLQSWPFIPSCRLEMVRDILPKSALPFSQSLMWPTKSAPSSELLPFFQTKSHETLALYVSRFHSSSKTLRESALGITWSANAEQVLTSQPGNCPLTPKTSEFSNVADSQARSKSPARGPHSNLPVQGQPSTGDSGQGMKENTPVVGTFETPVEFNLSLSTPEQGNGTATSLAAASGESSSVPGTGNMQASGSQMETSSAEAPKASQGAAHSNGANREQAQSVPPLANEGTGADSMGQQQGVSGPLSSEPSASGNVPTTTSQGQPSTSTAGRPIFKYGKKRNRVQTDDSQIAGQSSAGQSTRQVSTPQGQPSTSAAGKGKRPKRSKSVQPDRQTTGQTAARQVTSQVSTSQEQPATSTAGKGKCGRKEQRGQNDDSQTTGHPSAEQTTSQASAGPSSSQTSGNRTASGLPDGQSATQNPKDKRSASMQRRRREAFRAAFRAKRTAPATSVETANPTQEPSMVEGSSTANPTPAPVTPRVRVPLVPPTPAADVPLFLPSPTLCGLPNELKWKLASYMQPQDACRVTMAAPSWRHMAPDKAFWNFMLGRCPEGDVRVGSAIAKKVYHLTEKDIHNVECIRPVDPDSRMNPPRMYRKSTIYLMALAKHGGLPGLLLKDVQIIESTEQKKEVKRDNTILRVQILRQELADIGQEIRDDSRMQRLYMKGGSGAPTIQEVVQSARQMHIIHEHSLYKKMLKDSYQDVVEESHVVGGFNERWKANKEEMQQQALAGWEYLKTMHAQDGIAPISMCYCGEPIFFKQSSL